MRGRIHGDRELAAWPYGRQVEFAVSAKWDKVLLMDGSHGRAVVDLARFFARLGMKAPGG